MNDKVKKGLALGILSLALAGVAAAHGGFGGGNGHVFEQSEDMQNAIENGDYESFKEITGKDWITQERFDHIVEMHENHEAVEEAIEAGDYDAWVEVVQKLPHGVNMADIISKEDFSTFVEMHEARESGDVETAHDLREELGLPVPGLSRGEMGCQGAGIGQNKLSSRGFRFRGR